MIRFAPTAVLLALACALAPAAVATPAQAQTPPAKKKAKKPKLKSKWLCGPRGPSSNPCQASQTATVLGRGGVNGGTRRGGLARNPRVDCFYVYPTVSPQPGPNSNLRIGPEQRAAAQIQASRFSNSCRVYAPVYRQVTQAAFTNPAANTKAARARAYADVRTAWREYLKYDNKGRGVVLIGHDQGAQMLTQLLAKEIERKTSSRDLLVSAILPGANVTTLKGRRTGGSFRVVEPCRSNSQVGCFIAYSTFGEQPPPDAAVSRVYSPVFRRPPDRTKRVACTNPSALVGGVGENKPYFPTRILPGPLSAMSPAIPVGTPWVYYPGLYTSRCTARQGATWLQITPTRNAADPRVRVQPVQGPQWGYHLADMNLFMAQLVTLVKIQAGQYPKVLRERARERAEEKREAESARR
ncbi:MAG TPA: DUF3089 domain-containing protein [Thermoleophilaceae bacterium]|nr:DUF3089 domain-containing protein [Thermoleophilaceae bacterium]